MTTNIDTQATTRRPFIRDDAAYWLPFLVFISLTQVGNWYPSLYAYAYFGRAVLVAVLLVLFWRYYTKVRWNHWWLGVIVGVIGILQWVPMQLWLQDVTRDTWIYRLFKPSDDPFNPFDYFGSAPPAVLWGFIAIRIASATLVVPVMEELFWRDFLWRTIIAPNDFKLAAVGEWDWKAFVIVSLAFGLVHGNWWLTAIVWGAMVAGLLVYTKSIGACIIAHAVTNLLLAIYVLVYKDWAFW